MLASLVLHKGGTVDSHSHTSDPASRVAPLTHMSRATCLESSLRKDRLRVFNALSYLSRSRAPSLPVSIHKCRCTQNLMCSDPIHPYLPLLQRTHLLRSCPGRPSPSPEQAETPALSGSLMQHCATHDTQCHLDPWPFSTELATSAALHTGGHAAGDAEPQRGECLLAAGSTGGRHLAPGDLRAQPGGVPGGGGMSG